MDDLTRIKGIGKTYAVRLAQAGFETYAALANATGEAELRKLQDAGFENGIVEAWAKEAAALVADAARDDGGQGPGDDKGAAAGAQADQIVRRPLVAAQEVRHLGVTYGPGTPLPDTVDDVEAGFLLARGSATR